VLPFGFLYNVLGDDMIGVFPEPAFFAREVLEMPFGGLCPTLLQALTKGLMPLAVAFNKLTAERLTFAIGGKVDYTQVDTEGVSSFIGCWSGNVKGYSQIENAVAIEQVRLPFHRIHTGLLVCSYLEGNQDAPLEGQEGNGQQALKAHDPFIVDDSPFWLKGWLNALVSLVGFTGLTNGPNSQLSRKLVGTPQLTIHEFLQFKFVGGLLTKRDLSHIIASSVKGVHGFKQGLMLFSCRRKFQEHGLFHRTSILRIEKSVNGQESPTTHAPNKERLSSRPMNGDRHPGDLRGETNLGRINLFRADLSGADLSKADLWEAHLSGVYLMGANLSDANLARADLSHADLNSTNLSDAVLRDANLRGALLMHANLSRSDLCGANLREAIVTANQLKQAQPLDDCL
jgi:Pentapeptide repeats (8 copies)